ncbi:MAG: hypothetical protein WCV92_04440 [Candidatus Buchananbacteria bacterium]
MLDDYSYNESKIKIKKDYLKKSFSNPYFDKFKRGFNTKFYLKILLVIFLVYVFIYSDVFKIKNVEITGNDLISQDEFKNSVNSYLNQWTFFLLPKNNLIIFNKPKLKDEVSKKFALDSIEIKKGWQKLKISIKEKICYLIINNGKAYYYVGLDGIITKQLSSDEIIKRQNQLPVININKDVNIGDRLFSEQKINYILGLDKKLEEIKIAPKYFEDRGVVEVSVIFAEGWQAYFDMNSDVNISVENLKLILDKKIKDRKSLQYIDLRMGDKVYYK